VSDVNLVGTDASNYLMTSDLVTTRVSRVGCTSTQLLRESTRE